MCDLLPSANAEMTLPNADSDLLMFLASSSTVPSAPVLDTCEKNIVHINQLKSLVVSDLSELINLNLEST